MTPRWDGDGSRGNPGALIPPDIAKLLGYVPPAETTPDTTKVPTALGASDPIRRGATRRRRYVGVFDQSRLTSEQRAELAVEAEQSPTVPDVEQQQPPATTKRDAVVLRLFGPPAPPTTDPTETIEQE